MKYSLLICFCFFWINAFTLSQNEVADSLYQTISKQLKQENCLSVCFQVQESNTKYLLFILSKNALKENYTVCLNADSADVCVQIESNTFETYQKKKILFYNKTKKIFENEYMITYINIKKNRLIATESLTYMVNPNIAQSTVKWYDPFLMMAVVGSLIYLIYYGNQ